MMPDRPDETPFSRLAAGLAPPVVVFCKSHSGSRLLAAALQRLGVFLGSVLNESLDSLPMLPVVEYVVGRYHPDFNGWWRQGRDQDHELAALVQAAIDTHLTGRPRTTSPWGWKLCETVYALPVIDAVFPAARYIHIIRDGRDVAFCDHVAPDRPFWKKVYFGTDRIMAWRSRRLGHKEYRRRSHLFNACHWRSSVGLGCAYGALLGPRYLEVRYERLCLAFEEEIRRIASFLAIPPTDSALALKAQVSVTSIGKHRQRPREMLREVLEIETPLLLALGYLDADPLEKPSRSLRGRVSNWWKGTPRAAA